MQQITRRFYCAVKEFIRRKKIGEKVYSFDPSWIYEKHKEEDHKYIDEYLNTLINNKVRISYISMPSVPQKTQDHLQFRMRNLEDLYKLQKSYAEFVFKDDKILQRYGLYDGKDVSFCENDLPDLYIERLREKVALPLGNDVLKELIKCKKKALYPPEVYKDGDNVYSQMWLLGRVGNVTALFRLYEEKKVRKTGDFFSDGSGLSLEMYVRGKAFGGKYLVRSDFKPLHSHLNITRNGEVQPYGYDVIAENLKLNYINNFPDHSHIYNLGINLLMPKHGGVDIVINNKEPRNYSDFYDNFLKRNNIDIAPIYESKDEKRNDSLPNLAKEYCTPIEEKEQGGLTL